MFKVGQQVRCIDRTKKELQYGKIYTIVDMREDRLCPENTIIYFEKFGTGYFSYRFEEVKKVRTRNLPEWF